jgi:hypothetical protein
MAAKLGPGRPRWAKWINPGRAIRVHGAVNVGKEVFEEVVTFFLDRPDTVPQPEDNSGDTGR